MPWGDSAPVDTPDLAIVGTSTAVEVLLALVALRFVANRRWPAYIAKNCGLVPYTALAGMLANLAVAMRYGWWGVVADASEAPVGCNAEAWLLWSGVGGFFACTFLRVYRYHNVLVLHNGFMWPVPLQLAILSLPFLLPPAFFTLHTGVVAFDEDTQECERQSEKPEAFAFGAMAVLAAATAALTFSLRGTRLQAPEEVRAAVTTSVAILLAVIVLPLLHEGLEQEPEERRRAMLAASSLTTLVVVASPLVGPLKGFVSARDEKSKAREDLSFNRTRQPGELQKMSQDRMKVNALASSPGGRYTPESSAMAWFFRDSLDRESIRDPFLLQAATMRILKTYVQAGAPMSIPLSPTCREEMLTSKATSTVIFNRARQEVMEKLGGDRVTYCASPTATGGSGESVYAESTRGNGGNGTTPGPLVVKPRLRARGTRNAAVSAGQIKRNGLGAIGDGPSDLSTAFGLHPVVRQGSGFEEGPAREKCSGLFVGRGRVARGKGDGGHNLGGRFDPFEDSGSPRRDEMSAVEMPEFDRSGSFSDLDPFRGLQGTLDFNFAESIASIEGLAESMGLSESTGLSESIGSSRSMGLSGKRKLGFTDTYRTHKKNNEVSISGSSSSEDDDDGYEQHVVNPIFVGELKQAVERRRKKSG